MSTATTNAAAAVKQSPLPVSDYPNSFHQATWVRYVTAWNEALATHLGTDALKDALSPIVHGYLMDDDSLIREMQIAKRLHEKHDSWLKNGAISREENERFKGLAQPEERYEVVARAVERQWNCLLPRIGGLLGYFELPEYRLRAPTTISSDAFGSIYFHKIPPDGIESYLQRQQLNAAEAASALSQPHSFAQLLVPCRFFAKNTDSTSNGTLTRLVVGMNLKTDSGKYNLFPRISMEVSLEKHGAETFNLAIVISSQYTVLDPEARASFANSEEAQRFFRRADAYAGAQAPLQCAPNCHCQQAGAATTAAAAPTTTTAKPKKE
jgi:hypothetical protein